MAIICDGMGGLQKGELASATVVRAFSKWFEEELPFELNHVDMNVIGGKWTFLLKDLNLKLLKYSSRQGESLGTTFSGILFIENQYVIVHVGDSRVYQIDSALNQLTTDQTFVAREVSKGNMTIEQSKKLIKRRNLIASMRRSIKKLWNHKVLLGTTKKGAYMLCSDGFRHEITEEEIYESFIPKKLSNKKMMHKQMQYLIQQVKKRQEKDNISVILIKAE